MRRATGRAPASYEHTAHRLTYAAVLAPIALTVLVIHARGWWPTNDDAFTAMAMRDIWTGHPRVMGPWASTIGFIGVYPHHPGPALYYATSVGALPFGFSALGVLIGVALVNGLSAAATVHIGRRLGGLPGAVAGAFAVLITALYIGVGLFFRPFNPFPPLLMILLMLFVATDFIRGHRERWPLFAVAGTIALQSHLSYAYLVVGLSVVLLVVGAIAWHRERDAWWPMRGWLPEGAARSRQSWPMRCCIVLAVLLWVPVVIELLTYQPNNFTSLLDQMRISSPGMPATTVDRFEYIARGMVPAASAPVGKAVATLAAVLLVPIASGARAVRAPRVLAMAARIGLAGIALFGIQIFMVPHSAYFAEPWMVASSAPVMAFVWVVLVSYVASRARLLLLRPRWTTWRGPLTTASTVLALCGLAVTGTVLAADATSASKEEIVVGQDVLAAGANIAETARRWPTDDGSVRAIAVHGSGLGPVFEISPSLGLALRNDGFDVYLPPAIQGHDDTAFRRTDRAPAGAVRVLVVWLNQQPSQTHVPKTAQAMGTVHQGENVFRIYAVPPRGSSEG